jgi:hypothetical protein
MPGHPLNFKSLENNQSDYTAGIKKFLREDA